MRLEICKQFWQRKKFPLSHTLGSIALGKLGLLLRIGLWWKENFCCNHQSSSTQMNCERVLNNVDNKHWEESYKSWCGDMWEKTAFFSFSIVVLYLPYLKIWDILFLCNTYNVFVIFQKMVFISLCKQLKTCENFPNFVIYLSNIFLNQQFRTIWKILHHWSALFFPFYKNF